MSELVQTDFKIDQMKELVARILQESLDQGASQAEVDLDLNKGFTVTVRKGDVETVEYHQDKMIGITVYFGKRSGSASLSDLRPEAIHDAVKAACNIARFTDEDEFSGLAEKEWLAFNYPTLSLAFPWDISVPHAIELASECEALALSKDKRIFQSEGASLSTLEGWQMYANTQGFMGFYPATRHEMSCVLIGKQGEEMQQGHHYTLSVDPTGLDSISQLAEMAVERTVRRLGATRLTTRQVPVIFAAEEARGFLGHFISAIQGANLYRKSSFLLDQLGQPIFPAHITIKEHPHLDKSLGSAPFDNDGVATRENVFIEEGILKSYALGVYSARKLKMKCTGNAGGVHNLSITTGQKNLTQLLKTMGTGLLVTELMGHGTNLVTGDYSQGASGFWIENGEIQYPVEEITIAGNLRQMYADVLEVGNDVDRRGNIHTGSILVKNMMVAGD